MTKGGDAMVLSSGSLNGVVVACMWLSAGSYGLAAILAIWAALLAKDKLMRAGVVMATAGIVVHTVGIAARWWAAGRFPFVAQYENALVGSWAIALAMLLFIRRYRELELIAAFVLPVVILTLGYSASLSPAIPAYLPAYKSGWLVVHVTFAWFTYATYSVAAGLGMIEIAKALRGRRSVTAGRSGVLAKLPSADTIGDMTFRLVVFGFIVNAVMIVSGAIWAYRLWGSYWSWDPVESWSLVTWLAYGLYLHLRLTLGWRGTRLAWVAVLALLGVLMTFWGVQLMPATYHLFQRMGAGKVQGLQ